MAAARLAAVWCGRSPLRDESLNVGGDQVTADIARFVDLLAAPKD
jgi:hypothetical protein